jgi:hypothetical protein
MSGAWPRLAVPVGSANKVRPPNPRTPHIRVLAADLHSQNPYRLPRPIQQIGSPDSLSTLIRMDPTTEDSVTGDGDRSVRRAESSVGNLAADSRQLRIDAREQAIGNHRAALHPGQRHNRSITKPLADGAAHTFAPAAETWARTTVRSNICAGFAVSLNAAGASKKTSKVPTGSSARTASRRCSNGQIFPEEPAK